MSGAADPAAPTPLLAALERSRDLGFLGPGPIEPHVEHARAMVGLIPADAQRILDLGAGGGVPGLVVAALRERAEVVFLDAMRRRCQFLEDVVMELGFAPRVQVVNVRAEVAARDPRWREQINAITARSFGSPAVTAECATGFLALGGVLVTSEPPAGEPGRWPEESLAQLGLGPARLERVGGRSYAVMVKQGSASDRWPRRTGVPERKPLWGSVGSRIPQM